MTIDPSDPKWTAYVMNELAPEQRRQIEGILTRSPEARRLVADIRETVGWFEEGVETDPQLRLTPEQMTRLDGGTRASGWVSQAVFNFGWRVRPTLIGLALVVIAASLLQKFFAPDHEWRDSRAEVPLIQRETVSEPGSASGESFAQDHRRNQQPVVEAPAYGMTVHTVPGDVTSNDSPSKFERRDTPAADPYVAASAEIITHCLLGVGADGYHRVRELVGQGALPNDEQIRVEELVNYFPYDYPEPPRGRPLSLNLEVANCPWNDRNRLVTIGLRAGTNSRTAAPPLRIFLLLDGLEIRKFTFDRAALVQTVTALRERLGHNDHLIIVESSRPDGAFVRVAASSPISGVLESLASGRSPRQFPGANDAGLRSRIVSELDRRGRNELVLVVDNLTSSKTDGRLQNLSRLQREAPSPTAMSVLNLGKDSPWGQSVVPEEVLVRSVRNIAQAHHFWGELLARSRERVADQISLQLEFDPEQVRAYRLVGVDEVVRIPAGHRLKVGPGHELRAEQEVTALFEVVPVGENPRPNRSRPLLAAQLDYRSVADDRNLSEKFVLIDDGRNWREASNDFRFAASVAAYGMLLAEAPYQGTINYYGVLELAQRGLDLDVYGHRLEFLELVKRTVGLQKKKVRFSAG